ncbi:MAG TPA: formate dehydrogenase accessory protein FdhE [Amaricoccus sp.]|nr:formate dehydrogenase accessory protein FdhE [Amaricoccus sp.]
MSKPVPPAPDPSAIGVIPKPPFARLPDPSGLFARRAARCRKLAAGHDLGPFLGFLAGLAEAQHAVGAGAGAGAGAGLGSPAMPTAETLERAERHAMPPLDRAGFRAGPETMALIDRLLALVAEAEMPAAARAAVERVTAADDAARAEMAANVLADAIPFEAVAEHALVAAALQVQFAGLAAGLDAGRLKAVGDGVCPACGGPPSASLIVGWTPNPGVRYCSCSLCGTLWNYVRAKCTICGSTSKISFREIEGGGGLVKAELCGECHGYVKVMYQQQQPDLDPIADDVATLGLDLLVQDLGFRRGAVNPFLIGY